MGWGKGTSSSLLELLRPPMGSPPRFWALLGRPEFVPAASHLQKWGFELRMLSCAAL